RELREIRDELNLRDETTAAGIDLSELSMGMSGDFIPAVEEGATLVRVGSRLFAGLPTP
ncbi:MAG: YggS family pyridoxal phosphate-dependent enzyme, partial [Planctomycetaceae bacterium]